MWNHLAKWIANSPRVRQAIIDYAFARPYYDLYDKDGTLYMKRGWLLPKFCLGKDDQGNPFPKKWVPFYPRVHFIAREDRDRHLHDHPASYRQVMMDGWYDEENIFGEINRYEAGSTRKAVAHNFHRLVKIRPEGVYTIFIMTKRIHNWGFLVDGHKVRYQDYFSQWAQ